MEPQLKLAERNDVEDLSAYFAEHRRIQIPGLLTDQTADTIYQALSTQPQWNIVWNDHGKHVDMDYDGVMQLPKAQLTELREKVLSQAAHQFQYLYANIPLYDIYRDKLLPGHFFNSIFEFINSKPVLDMFRAVTGFEQIRFADAQITRYSAGHFLTEHSDEVIGKGRLAAYVLNLTPIWRPDWGGALMFPNTEGGFSECLFPTFNALNIFAVPQKHLVSMVSSFATEHRYSITGWLRTNE